MTFHDIPGHMPDHLITGISRRGKCDLNITMRGHRRGLPSPLEGELKDPPGICVIVHTRNVPKRVRRRDWTIMHVETYKQRDRHTDKQMDAAAMTTLHLAGAGVDNSVTVWVAWSVSSVYHFVCLLICMIIQWQNH